MRQLFETFFVVGNLAKFRMGNLNCLISETEGCQKLKFREVSLQNRQKILREHQAKNFST